MKPGYFSRTGLLLGDDVLESLAGKTVAVFGLGGVGSFATETLARGGIGGIRIVDVDSVQPTNFNRQLFATMDKLDVPKVDAARDRLLTINPALHVDRRSEFFHHDTADALLEKPVDFVIDAIDGFNPKVALILECRERGIPFVSCMGGANRIDPTAVKMGDISKTEVCPLARVVRKKLRTLRIRKGVPCVYSDEHVVQHIEQDYFQDAEETFTRGRRRRTQPSMGAVPAVIGVTAAQYVLLTLAGVEKPWMAKQPSLKKKSEHGDE